MLWIGAMEDDVCQHIDSLQKVFVLYSAVEDRIFFIGEGIEFAAHTFNGVDYLHGTTVLGAFE